MSLRQAKYRPGCAATLQSQIWDANSHLPMQAFDDADHHHHHYHYHEYHNHHHHHHQRATLAPSNEAIRCVG